MHKKTFLPMLTRAVLEVAIGKQNIIQKDDIDKENHTRKKIYWELFQLRYIQYSVVSNINGFWVGKYGKGGGGKGVFIKIKLSALIVFV